VNKIVENETFNISERGRKEDYLLPPGPPGLSLAMLILRALPESL